MIHTMSISPIIRPIAKTTANINPDQAEANLPGIRFLQNPDGSYPVSGSKAIQIYISFICNQINMNALLTLQQLGRVSLFT